VSTLKDLYVQVLLLAMFLSCILKKPDIDDDDLSEDDNHLKHDEEFLSRSERDIQGILLLFLCCYRLALRLDSLFSLSLLCVY